VCFGKVDCKKDAWAIIVDGHARLIRFGVGTGCNEMPAARYPYDYRALMNPAACRRTRECYRDNVEVMMERKKMGTGWRASIAR